jgi:hypothetical protein
MDVERFEILTAVSRPSKITVFWEVTPCDLVRRSKRTTRHDISEDHDLGSCNDLHLH